MGVAFLLSGQGAQKPGMGAALIEQGAPEVAETFVIASEAFGFDVADVCLNASAETLRDTAFAQPAMCTLSVAVAKAHGKRARCVSHSRFSREGYGRSRGGAPGFDVRAAWRRA